MLEALCHEEKCFITLTYANCGPDSSLYPEDLQQWLKRIRRRAEPRRLRFFAVGEYGDQSERPHYHIALFGWPPCVGGPIRNGVCECFSCSGVRETWGLGFVHVGRLEPDSAQYLCGYVVKKMTAGSDFRLRGRHPEFARMSLRPGIGAGALTRVVSAMQRYQLDNRLPQSLQHGRKSMPFGRYLKKKLSEGLGHTDLDRERFAEDALSRSYEQLSVVRSYAVAVEKTVREVFAEANEGVEKALGGRASLKARRRL